VQKDTAVVRIEIMSQKLKIGTPNEKSVQIMIYFTFFRDAAVAENQAA
jgi:hypothetical protein